MVHSPVTLPDIHRGFFFFLLLHIFFQEAVLFFSHLASFHHSFSQDWHISTEAEACHTFADMHPEDDMIEMISYSISTHTAVLHSVSLLSCRSTSLCVDLCMCKLTKTDTFTQVACMSRHSCVHECLHVHTYTHRHVIPLNARYYCQCVTSANALWLWDKCGLKN